MVLMLESVFRRRFGGTLKQLREQRAFTQRELAESSQIAEKYLSRIELGLATPSVHVAFRLAQALNASLDGMLGSPKKSSPRQQKSQARGRTRSASRR